MIMSAPKYRADVDRDGRMETVYDYAREDFGPETFELLPRQMNLDEVPFELAFAERKYMQVFLEKETAKDARLVITALDGVQKEYVTDENGWIDGLPVYVLQKGFTAEYTPDGENVYRFSYALETFAYFTPHFYRAYIPLMYVDVFTVFAIGGFYFYGNGTVKSLVKTAYPEYICLADGALEEGC